LCTGHEVKAYIKKANLLNGYEIKQDDSDSSTYYYAKCDGLDKNGIEATTNGEADDDCETFPNTYYYTTKLVVEVTEIG
jgi:hypothetical protein